MRCTHCFHSHLWPVWLCKTSSHFLSNGKIFGLALIFSAILSEPFLIIIIILRDITVNVHKSSCKVGYLLFLSNFNQSSIFRQIFKTFRNVKINKNPSSGSRIPCGRTDITELTVAYHNVTNEPRNKQTCKQSICSKNCIRVH